MALLELIQPFIDTYKKGMKDLPDIVRINGSTTVGDYRKLSEHMSRELKYGWQIIGGHRCPAPVSTVIEAEEQIKTCREWNQDKEWKDQPAVITPVILVEGPGYSTYIPAGEAHLAGA